MREKVLIILFALFSTYAYTQQSIIQPGSNSEQQLENLTEQQESETEDDSYLQTMVQFKKNPVNLNTAGENELYELKLLSDLQIQSLLSYRRLLGNFISIYELQAVPLWDIQTIQLVLPYIE